MEDQPKVGAVVTRWQAVAACVKSMVAEIRVNKRLYQLKSFRKLHDVVDANMLGGGEYLYNLYGTEESHEVIELSQTIVDYWLGLENVDRETWQF